jgi:hypothetical protein
MSKKAVELLVGKLPVGAHPHHSFHVLDVSMRTGALKESIDDLDKCRISWGEVARIDGDELVVNYRPLTLKDGKMALGDLTERRARYLVQGRGYLHMPLPGEMVSMHWNWVCDMLTPRQAAVLESQTNHHLAIANLTI